ncbi:MAG TPA: hypothetical protein VE987_05630, partial [Polyangiaceae bacterium]|nr:hypothetical protein [Polyangiaceae bacterium]
MKTRHAIQAGASFVMISAGVWFGCSSSSNNGPDGGSEGGSSSSSGSSSGGGSSSGAGSSSGGGSSSGAGSSSGGGSSSGSVTDASVTWGQVYSDVIQKYCAGCHGPNPDGGPARGGLRVGMLDMTSPEAGLANLIGVAARGTAVPAIGYDAAVVCSTLAEAGAPGSIRVVPGDAGASLLYLKVHGYDAPPPCGAPMPEPAPGPGEIDSGIGQAAAAVEIMNW